MGRASYPDAFRACATPSPERKDTSCSKLHPPFNTPTRVRVLTISTGSFFC
ncbi:MAG: hypothetical protein BWY09_01627 [Candidatus Hydrogenedentes bacterium ADurb.Bin179]|nr:MAG: hypothetical protein BWY09_01627 [Candidatus Hydrogenedentes bacterium ADurb.Bin179]